MKQATKTDDTETIKHAVSTLDTDHTVKALIKTVRKMEGFKVNHDTDAGTVRIYCKGWKVFQGIQKGAGKAPWIVRRNSKLFTY